MNSQMEIKCAVCSTTKSNIWEKNEQEEKVCIACWKLNFPGPSSGSRRLSVHLPVRKSLRVATKLKDEFKVSPDSTKTRGKRGAPSKVDYESAPAFAVPVLRPMLHDGVFFQHGDIVSVTPDNKKLCYAQIRGLFRDQYGEKYAVLTWLVPTEASPKGYFDPDTYIIGPEDELPIKMTGVKFVCNPPSDRYMIKGHASQMFPPLRAEFGVLFKKTGPEIVPLLPEEAYTNPYNKVCVEKEGTWRDVDLPLPEAKRGRRDSKKR